MFEKNNPTIALNILYAKEKEIRLVMIIREAGDFGVQ